MSIPILTHQQQQKSLSAKKKTKKQTIKNLLTSPYSNYWPVVNSEDCVCIDTVLQQNLAVVKKEKEEKLPWSVMKKIPREDRKKYRSKPILKSVSDRDYVLGINETSRFLENNGVSLILLSAEVNPPLMVRHILDIAVLKKVAILLVPDLKNTLKILTGVGSVGIAFKVNLSEGSNCTQIVKLIKEICLKYPVPTNHVNYDRCNLFTLSNEDEDITDEEMLKEKVEEIETDLYLYRSSNKERVFKPELSKLPEDHKTDENLEFISFGNNDLPVEHNKPKKRKISYKSLIVKRVKNNQFRNRKKIEILKKPK